MLNVTRIVLGESGLEYLKKNLRFFLTRDLAVLWIKECHKY